MRERAIKNGDPPVPSHFGGVTKARIELVLRALGAFHVDLVDAVFALLDNTPSWFAAAPHGMKFKDGATTAQLGCHVGILQRGISKLDREGRDYWIKPLRDLGGIEAVYFLKDERRFIAGHPKAKSPNSAYRLAPSLVEILQAPEGQWQARLKVWVSTDEVRQRAEFQAKVAAEDKKLVDTSHTDLIEASVEHYAKKFLPGFAVIYVDDGDGDRITDDDRAKLKDAGIEMTLADAMPDVLLWNSESDELWVIEAVTSDGEVDGHKVRQLQGLAKRCGKQGIGFTTTYRTWKEAAQRQDKNKNLAIGSFVWIWSDPSKQMMVGSWSTDEAAEASVDVGLGGETVNQPVGKDAKLFE